MSEDTRTNGLGIPDNVDLSSFDGKGDNGRKYKYGMVYVRKPREEGGFYTYKDKLKAATTYVATGNRSLTAKITGIPLVTLNTWAKKDWWIEMLRDLAVTEKMEKNKHVKKIADQALNVVMDRLQHGDVQYDQKTGTVVRVPVNVRNAHKIAMDSLTREDLIEDRIERLQKQEETEVKDTLVQLAEQFAKFANKEHAKRAIIDVEDVIVVDEPQADASGPDIARADNA
jgi:hypothetical protein